jgi:hypothetical protein
MASARAASSGRAPAFDAASPRRRRRSFAIALASRAVEPPHGLDDHVGRGIGVAVRRKTLRDPQCDQGADERIERDASRDVRRPGIAVRTRRKSDDRDERGR